TGTENNVSTSDKETQIDHISLLKEYELIRDQHPEQFRPYIEVQRLRKDSETMSSPPISTVSRIRRESNQFRAEMLSDGGKSLREVGENQIK
ncbi:unnamed protein product, partial [Didymodactylos carnosus]